MAIKWEAWAQILYMGKLLRNEHKSAVKFLLEKIHNTYKFNYKVKANMKNTTETQRSYLYPFISS